MFSVRVSVEGTFRVVCEALFLQAQKKEFLKYVKLKAD